MTEMTHMRREIEEIPDAVARLLEGSKTALAEAGRDISRRDPRFVVTVARGSSDHAASYLKYAVELTAGLAVASVGPSVASIYRAPLKLNGSACVAISQSGKSPDIVAMAEAARKAGSLTIALTNTAELTAGQGLRAQDRHPCRRREERRRHQDFREFGGGRSGADGALHQ